MAGRSFTCAICFEKAEREAVVTVCGHLFCWPCLCGWLESEALSSTSISSRRCCPSCRSPQVLPLISVARKLEQEDSIIGKLSDFACRRCLKAEASQPVILSTCGHLYCWPCLYPLLFPNENHHTAVHKCNVKFCESSFDGVRGVSPVFVELDVAQHSASPLSDKVPPRTQLLSASPTSELYRSLPGKLAACMGHTYVFQGKLRTLSLLSRANRQEIADLMAALQY